MGKAIFVAATAQHVGKTTTCLGIFSGLAKRFDKVGFMKPVGQQHVSVGDDLQVDKDVALFHERFGMRSDYRDMSPVIFPRGYTRRYLDGEVDAEGLRPEVAAAFERIRDAHDYTLVEGTGHTGVGSIINLSNADVAALLGLEAVLISTGGIGAAFDQLAINRQLLLAAGVPIRAIILNRVLPEKREMVLHYVTKAVERWEIPIAGCIPYSPLLDAPSMRDYENLFGMPLIAGEAHRYRHFTSERVVLIEADAFRNDHTPNMLVITHATRDDIIEAALERGDELERGMILTGHAPPSDRLVEKMGQAGMPVLYAPVPSFKAMQMINGFTAKIRKEDVDKVEKAISLVEENVNFELLCR